MWSLTLVLVAMLLWKHYPGVTVTLQAYNQNVHNCMSIMHSLCLSGQWKAWRSAVVGVKCPVSRQVKSSIGALVSAHGPFNP